MKLLREFVGAACLSALVSVSPAQAATLSVMTFDGIPEFGGDPQRFGAPNLWVEDGITATGGGDQAGGEFGYHLGAQTDTAYLADGGTSFPSAITFTMQGRFDAISFDLIPSSLAVFCLEGSFFETCFDSANNVSITGIRDGLSVAEDAFFMGTEQFNYLFSELFTDLDSLVIAAVLPAGLEFLAPSSAFNIDNVTLAAVTPVPIPAPLLLFLTGIAGLGIIGRRARRRSLSTATTRG
jgi:hypothetical protein